MERPPFLQITPELRAALAAALRLPGLLTLRADVTPYTSDRIHEIPTAFLERVLTSVRGDTRVEPLEHWLTACEHVSYEEYKARHPTFNRAPEVSEAEMIAASNRRYARMMGGADAAPSARFHQPTPLRERGTRGARLHIINAVLTGLTLGTVAGFLVFRRTQNMWKAVTFGIGGFMVGVLLDTSLAVVRKSRAALQAQHHSLRPGAR